MNCVGGFMPVTACTVLRSLRSLRSVHGRVIIAFDEDSQEKITAENKVLSAHVRCGKIRMAHKLLDGMPQRDVVSCGTLMAGYFHKGMTSEVIWLFKAMASVDDLRPNNYITAIALSSCANDRRVQEGRQLHVYVLKSGLLFHQYVKNALLHMYTQCSEAIDALHLFDTMTEWVIVAHNSLLNGLIDNGYHQQATNLLSKMLDLLPSWDKMSFLSAFRLCSRLRTLKLGLQVHNQMIMAGARLDLYLGSSIIDMYGRCGRLLDSKKVFGSLTTHNVVSWTSMISSFFRNGFFEEALKLFLAVESSNSQPISPNEYTFAVLINCTAGLASLNLGDSLHSRVRKSGFQDHVIIGNSLIHMYSKSGTVGSASRVFSMMKHRDTVTWNSMISGFSQHGDGVRSLSLFHKMRAAGEVPNGVTFVGVLTACAHLCRVDEGFFYVNHLMRRTGVEIGLEHHTCIVSLLSRAGRLSQAEDYMRRTPIEWDVIAWRCLLNACAVHKDVPLGERVADVILRDYPRDMPSYVLLSNVYAGAKQWDGVASTRILMRERNVKKEPGVSWIDVDHVVHVFASGSVGHPDSVRVHKKVRALMDEIRALGYLPDAASALHDVGDNLIEEHLMYHSERLATAYGLMKTPPSAPVRVFTNIRMCRDCHSALKLISKVTARTIVVRDSSRFHTFNTGLCSCVDYW